MIALSQDNQNQPFVFSPAEDEVRARSGAAMGQPSSGSSNSGHDSLVQQTRREISQIIREIAQRAQEVTSVGEFAAFLCDRVLRAMAAEGVIVWRYDANPRGDAAAGIQFEVVRRLGRLTDASFSEQVAPVHQRLLQEVLASGTPVVVPPTPGVLDSAGQGATGEESSTNESSANQGSQDAAHNPTEFPAALVPIEVSGTGDQIGYLLEVFLEQEAGIATQRGYLRFVAQVADLCRDFFRGDQIRTLMRQQQLASRCDEILARLRGAEDDSECHRILVDQVADAFDLDRVALCRLHESPQLLAVSHVDEIDKHSEAAKLILVAAQWPELNERSVVSPMEPATPADASSKPSDPLSIRWVARGETATTLRLVGLQRTDRTSSTAVSQREWVRLIDHLHAVEIRNRQGRNRWWGSTPNPSQTTPVWRRRWIKKGLLACAIAMAVLMIPVPQRIESAAALRASDIQQIRATRDCIVEDVLVDHNDLVRQGQVIMRLRDPELEQQISELLGRQSVLQQQRSRLVSTVVDSQTMDADQLGQVETQQAIVLEELDSIEQQLRLLRDSERLLVLRANCDGWIDGWQVQQRLANRPVRRGDLLVRVIESSTHWLMDTSIPLKNVSRVEQLRSEQSFDISVLLDDAPESVVAASLQAIGPVRRMGPKEPFGEKSVGAEPASEVTLRLAESAVFSEDSSLWRDATRNGAPGRVVFHCGNTSLGDLLVGDLARSLRTKWKLHFGSVSRASLKTSLKTSLGNPLGTSRSQATASERLLQKGAAPLTRLKRSKHGRSPMGQIPFETVSEPISRSASSATEQGTR